MGHRRPLAMRRGTWIGDHEEPSGDGRVEFRRLVELEPKQEARSGRGPTVAAVVGLLVLAGVVVLAYVLYRTAPP